MLALLKQVPWRWFSKAPSKQRPPMVMHPAFRVLGIMRIVLRYALDDVLTKPPVWLRVLRSSLALWPVRRHWQQQPFETRLRLALLDGGPLFIKFGQALATRYDLLSDAMAASLSQLHDQVPAVEGDWVVDQLIHEWGSIDRHLASFDRRPLAAASIAQVYAATLHSGESVVVKVLRPHVRRLVERDLSWLRMVARIAERCWVDGRRLRLQAVVAEFERFTMNELDLRYEAANASQMRRSFEGSTILRIPRVHWDMCSKDVMVMERVHGVPIADIETLRSRGVDLSLLAKRGVEIFFTQTLRDRFFHADMHPGNIFVDANNPQDPVYIAVDFGIVGVLNAVDQRYLAENMLAFFKQDYARVAQLHVDAGWVPEDVDVLQFETTIRMVCEPIFQQPLEKISLGRLLIHLFQTARDFGMEVQPQLVLLQKTLLSIEGLGRRIDPSLDLWSTAQPMLERWLKSQVGVKAMWRTAREQGPFWWRSWLQLPQKVDQLLSQQVSPPSLPAESKWRAAAWCAMGALCAWLLMQGLAGHIAVGF